MLNVANSNLVDWRSIVGGLKTCGWSQQAVAEALGCSQGAISQLNTGRHADPTYSLGVRLLALHDHVQSQSAGAREYQQMRATHALTVEEICRWFQVPPWSFEGFLPAIGDEASRSALSHIPGDTTTPPAPGAVWIGTGDA